MPLEIVQVDAFAAHPFCGNPAGVCLLDAVPDEGWMQAMASEMNVAETAFVVPNGNGWQLRWFTPEGEIALCGHATLAAAHHLMTDCGVDDGDLLRFATLSGEVTATRTADGWIELDFPADRPVECEAPASLGEAIGGSEMMVAVSRSRQDYIVELASPDMVRSLEPDLLAMRAIEARGVVVTAVGDGLYDFVSRFFAPRVGIAEDPVTGSTHCALGPYWADRLAKTDLLAHQASTRAGDIRVGVRDDRVLIGGQACTVLRVQLDDLAHPRRPEVRSRRRPVSAAAG